MSAITATAEITMRGMARRAAAVHPIAAPRSRLGAWLMGSLHGLIEAKFREQAERLAKLRLDTAEYGALIRTAMTDSDAFDQNLVLFDDFEHMKALMLKVRRIALETATRMDSAPRLRGASAEARRLAAVATECYEAFDELQADVAEHAAEHAERHAGYVAGSADELAGMLAKIGS